MSGKRTPRQRAVARDMIAGIDNAIQASARREAAEAEKERFLNGGPCEVVERCGALALIHRKNSRIAPYVVPVTHRPGDREWDQGRYFGTYRAAKGFFDKEKERRMSET